MWKRMTDRLSEAVSSAIPTTGNNSSSDDERVAQLCSLGFRPAEARHALRTTNGDMQRASEWLLENGTPIGIDNHRPAAAATEPMTIDLTSNDDEDDEIQKAIQASLQDEQKNAKTKTTSAASKKAGQAALKRFDNKGDSSSSTSKPSAAAAAIASHPKVQVPKRLSQHDKEDVIMRCAARISFHPMAVDTLLRSLKTIQANPLSLKYQTIDTTTAGFQRSLNKPGVLDFLKAMNFYSIQNGRILKLSVLDPATFYLGISALEQVQQTSTDYANNKAMLAFEKELEQAMAAQDDQEAVKRADFMSKCPSESSSAGSQVTIELGSNIKISRKFDADDTLRDVVHWLGGHTTVIPRKLLETKEWHLVDRNHPDALPYSGLEENGVLDKTLQYVGCWPSGRLAIVPTLPHSVESTGIASSSRGLGAGPVDHFKKV
ncbi:MAG: hypothetical protein SGILL_004462 [Bacillariaceae sp.]